MYPLRLRRASTAVVLGFRRPCGIWPFERQHAVTQYHFTPKPNIAAVHAHTARSGSVLRGRRNGRSPRNARACQTPGTGAGQAGGPRPRRLPLSPIASSFSPSSLRFLQRREEQQLSSNSLNHRRRVRHCYRNNRTGRTSQSGGLRVLRIHLQFLFHVASS
ncbi:hypothetical protein BV25DRAFT_645809 [Artomyces pyxidatus]|uniref:Uncharacterized protein n=1 Tax=Artomyces pyxidatus TaxID=48021 RepID=A0ACB8T271_9AGAM|nr:hypothetical protein BV25DRAFT_645809 [Artomyces pyxidatus]